MDDQAFSTPRLTHQVVVMGNPRLGSGPLLEVAVQNVAETVTHPVLSFPGPNSTVLSIISSKYIYCEPNNTILLYLNSNMYQRQPHNGVIFHTLFHIHCSIHLLEINVSKTQETHSKH